MRFAHRKENDGSSGNRYKTMVWARSAGSA
jgi:hypothetical protein